MELLDPLGHSASKKQVAEYIASCNEAVPIELFDALSNKSIEQLAHENTLREVVIGRNPNTGVAVRKARNVKGFIWNSVANQFILEESRTYPNGKTVENYSPSSIERWSISETLWLGEKPIEGFVRGLVEEFGIKKESITILKIKDMFSPSEDYHPSTAYAGVYSFVETTWFNMETHQLSPEFNKRLIFKRDNGVIINRKWVEGLTQPHSHTLKY